MIRPLYRNTSSHQTTIQMIHRNFAWAVRIAVYTLAFAPEALAQTHYYVDSSWPTPGGTGGEFDPFQTIDALNIAVGNIPSGATVHLKRGGVYVGQINVDADATNVNIVADPELSDAPKPVLYGSIEATTWHGTGPVYWTELPTGATARYVYKDGELQPLARYPNTGWMKNGVYTPGLIEPHSTTPLPSGLVIDGAELVIRSYNWQYELEPVVTRDAQDRIQLLGNVQLELNNDGENTYDWGFFMQGTAPLADVPGEWYFDNTTDRVYFYNGANPPQDVRISIHDYGVNIPGGPTGSWGINVRNIQFMHQMEAGIGLRGSQGGVWDVEVTDCIFSGMYRGINDGNTVVTLGGSEFSNNTFLNCFDGAIRSYAGGTTTIRNNALLDIGLVPGLGMSGFGGHIGIRATGENLILDQNTLINIGYAGISVEGRASITHNTVHRSLAILNDGGAIQFDFTDQMLIDGNIIAGMGDPAVNLQSSASVNAAGTAYSAYEQISYGIYFGDKDIQNVTVQNNVISGCDKGIHVDHSLCSENAQILNNTLFNNRVQLSMTDYSNWTPNCGGDSNNQAANQGNGGTNLAASYNDNYTGNITYCLNGAQRCLEQAHVWPGSLSTLVDFGSFTSNYHFNPFSEAPFTIATKFRPPGYGGWQFTYSLDLPAWQTLEEPTALGSPLLLSDHAVTAVLSTPLDETFDGSVALNLWNCNLPGSRALEANALRCVGSPWTEKVTNCPITAEPPIAGKYRISFKLSSTIPTTLTAGFRYRDIGGYLGGRTFKATTSLLPYSFVVDVEDPPGNDWMYFNILDDQFGVGLTTSSSYLIDDVKVESVSVDPDYTAKIASEHILRYHNPLQNITDVLDPAYDPQDVPGSTGNFTVPEVTTAGPTCGLWSDVYGNLYAPGQGVQMAPWESIVLFQVQPPPTLAMINDEYHVTGSETFTDHYNVEGRIIVEAGATLTLDGATLAFAPSTTTLTSGITVQPGGTLNVKNYGQLRNWIGCTGSAELWDGVRVLSSYDPEGPAQQTWPGQVRMESGACIRNALVGVLCGEGDPANPGYVNSTPGTYGGVIETTDAVFENNRFDVVAKQWVSNTGTPSSSLIPEPCQARIRLVNTTFRTTAPLLNAGLHPVAHLRVADNQPFVHGCTFANELPAHTSSLEMGHGIDALNANLRVEPCLSGPCLAGSDQGNTFRNLDHAIHAVATEGAPFSTIRENTFTDNICGLYLKDLPGFDVRGNAVLMGRWDLGTGNYTNPDEFYWAEAHRGIFATGSNAFSIQDNSITRSPGNPTACEGIVVGYTGAENEVVFRNTATDLDRAYVGEGESADVNGDPNIAGLQFQCNTNVDNAVNFTSRPANGAPTPELPRHTIRGRQGTPTFSASNSFGGALHFEVSTTADAIAYVEYSHASGQAPATYTLQDPFNLDADYLQPVLVSGSLNCATDPPVWITGGGTTYTSVKPVLTSAKTEYGNLRYQYEQLIDGGSTDEVVQEIVEAWPQEILDLRASLLARSPYLSVAALKELMSKAGVPDAIRAEVLIANPDATKQEGFLRWAEVEAPYPLPGYLAQAVEASWNTRTYRTTLEEGLADKHTRLTQLVGHALRLLLTDSTPPPPDSLRWVWQQLRTNRARYSEAALLLGLGEHAEARAVVEAMPTEKDQKDPEEQERQRMLTYIGVLEAAAGQGRSAHQLNPAEVQQLVAMVDVHYDRPANWASNLLCAVYGQCRAPYTGGAGVEKSGGRTRDTSKPDDRSEASFGIYPNPARDQLTLHYEQGAEAQVAVANLRDANGRMVGSIPLNANAGQHTLSVAHLAPGAYTVQYLSGNRVVGTVPFLIQR